MGFGGVEWPADGGWCVYEMDVFEKRRSSGNNQGDMLCLYLRSVEKVIDHVCFAPNVMTCILIVITTIHE